MNIIQSHKNERVNLEFCNKLTSKLISINLDQNNIKGSGVGISSLAGERETISIPSRRKGIFPWDDNPELKEEEEKLKENSKQLTKNIEILVTIWKPIFQEKWKRN